MLNDILMQVKRPSRYFGEEWNVCKKNFDGAKIKFALCFPDLYEVGMSNLGIRIIYWILNSIQDVVCERVFAPDRDMEEILRKNSLVLFSLENKRGLKEFDLIGFSLGYELNYTNILNILDLGAIPFYSRERDFRYPLVIGGGPCVLNPEPLAEFFDFFVFGEGEEIILEIIELYRKYQSRFRGGQLSKEDLLKEFSCIEGIYVPSLYKVEYNLDGGIEEFKPRIEGIPLKIKKRILPKLDNHFYPLDWLVPYSEIVHDRLCLEIMRGCPNQCHFCQARSQYFPLRQRDFNGILNLATELYKRTGYEELCLLGLCVSDYPRIQELLEKLVDLFTDKGVSVSLPSITPKEYLANLSFLIAAVKKSGLTFAPEAATERLRNLLGKFFDPEEFFRVLKEIYAIGYQRIKLYFMVGLPEETTEDLDAIIEFAHRASWLRNEVQHRPAWINISVNTLIPKPHTPFQWYRMIKLEEIISKRNYLKNKIKKYQRLKLNFHNPYMSILEAVFSRGDRRLSRVILLAFRKGARFDAWEDGFNFSLWQEAFKEAALDYEFYLKERSKDEILPWEFLDIGISKDLLWRKFEKSICKIKR
ncbi:MAG: TIGR03960 family B12-binding radical SAM protein [Candidatus Omnitrophica bacterium]|nr:TIGR03960 family B12-binding radical SAM protein [Candidatus Omnitrophota bacterium]